MPRFSRRQSCCLQWTRQRLTNRPGVPASAAPAADCTSSPTDENIISTRWNLTIVGAVGGTDVVGRPSFSRVNKRARNSCFSPGAILPDSAHSRTFRSPSQVAVGSDAKAPYPWTREQARPTRKLKDNHGFKESLVQFTTLPDVSIPGFRWGYRHSTTRRG